MRREKNITQIENATSLFKSVKENAPPPLAPHPPLLVVEVKLC
jgi:hypothetical protein